MGELMIFSFLITFVLNKVLNCREKFIDNCQMAPNFYLEIMF